MELFKICRSGVCGHTPVRRGWCCGADKAGPVLPIFVFFEDYPRVFVIKSKFTSSHRRKDLRVIDGIVYEDESGLELDFSFPIDVKGTGHKCQGKVSH
jgi:hypothetical protein